MSSNSAAQSTREVTINACETFGKLCGSMFARGVWTDAQRKHIPGNISMSASTLEGAKKLLADIGCAVARANRVGEHNDFHEAVECLHRNDFKYDRHQFVHNFLAAMTEEELHGTR